MNKSLARRLRRPVAETLHMTHLLLHCGQGVAARRRRQASPQGFAARLRRKASPQGFAARLRRKASPQGFSAGLRRQGFAARASARPFRVRARPFSGRVPPLSRSRPLQKSVPQAWLAHHQRPMMSVNPLAWLPHLKRPVMSLNPKAWVPHRQRPVMSLNPQAFLPHHQRPVMSLNQQAWLPHRQRPVMSLNPKAWVPHRQRPVMSLNPQAWLPHRQRPVMSLNPQAWLPHLKRPVMSLNPKAWLPHRQRPVMSLNPQAWLPHRQRPVMSLNPQGWLPHLKRPVMSQNPQEWLPHRWYSVDGTLGHQGTLNPVTKRTGLSSWTLCGHLPDSHSHPAAASLRRQPPAQASRARASLQSKPPAQASSASLERKPPAQACASLWRKPAQTLGASSSASLRRKPPAQAFDASPSARGSLSVLFAKGLSPAPRPHLPVFFVQPRHRCTKRVVFLPGLGYAGGGFSLRLKFLKNFSSRVSPNFERFELKKYTRMLHLLFSNKSATRTRQLQGRAGGAEVAKNCEGKKDKQKRFYAEGRLKTNVLHTHRPVFQHVRTHFFVFSFLGRAFGINTHMLHFEKNSVLKHRRSSCARGPTQAKKRQRRNRKPNSRTEFAARPVLRKSLLQTTVFTAHSDTFSELCFLRDVRRKKNMKNVFSKKKKLCSAVGREGEKTSKR